MIVFESKLAKKYAIALLNVCSRDHADTQNECLLHPEIISTFYNFIQTNKIFQAILSLPTLSTEKKTEIIEFVAKRLHLPICIKKLIFLLLKHKRIDLLGNVLKNLLLIKRQYEKRHHFNISTSHTISDTDKEAIINFITTLVNNGPITASFDVNRSLISGIRIKGRTFFWERSIEKKLCKVEQTILRRE